MSSNSSSAPTEPAVCVFCGSSAGKNPSYLIAAESIGKAIAEKQWKLIYGGGKRGLMGQVSQSALENNGKVHGVIPRVMTAAPNGHPSQAATSKEGKGATILNPDQDQASQRLETSVVESMHQRKHMMSEKANMGFVALPGGFGTFEEVLEMVTWTQLGVHVKPMVLLNLRNFFSPLRTMIEAAIEEGFIPETSKDIISFVDVSDEEASNCGARILQEVEALGQKLSSGKVGYWDWNSSSKDVEMKVDEESQLKPEELAVSVPSLTFSFQPNLEPALENCSISLPKGSRALLVGANGAGKSTLLRILAGKRLIPSDQKVLVFGRDVFRNPPKGITYLGTEWSVNPVVRSDIVVSHFLDSIGGYRHKERRDRLLDILDVDVDWHMHAISDGERRRVQLCMGLMEPWDLLLLDEVTVDLDVQVRSDLLEFLIEETKTRKATIIYATHIFDGLQSFPTHLVHMRLGTTPDASLAWPPRDRSGLIQDSPRAVDSDTSVSPLLALGLRWLREDRAFRTEKENEALKLGKGRKRGARRGEETTDSEKFFAKYDYNQTVMR